MNRYLYGSDAELKHPVHLCAGILNVTYDDGKIRHIRLGNFEVLRMVYAAVRDHNWGTLEPVITEEKITSGKTSFIITFSVDYLLNEERVYKAFFTIEGNAASEISFQFKGEATASFKRNRIGICVLHPVREVSGKPCTVVTHYGSDSEGFFPEMISPHQPFQNIAAMHWKLDNQGMATLSFEGDVFETEDQRNWTDASFKTYCTPLSLPFPVNVNAGDKVNQKVILKVNVPENNISSDEQPLQVLFSGRTFNLPCIGICESSETAVIEDEQTRRIKNIGFSHYRVDIRFDAPNWKEKLTLSIKNSQKLKLQLELSVFFTGNPLEDYEQLKTLLAEFKADILLFNIFSKTKKITDQHLLGAIVPLIRRDFPKTRIGVGTDAYFTELNRERVDASLADYLTYSVNPQVHAFDLMSLVENAEAQGETVKSARKFAAGKDIHISPVTLRPRFNPNATESNDDKDLSVLPFAIDPRQNTLFTANWTLAGLKYLSQEGCASVTYYETVGLKGLMMGAVDSAYPHAFDANRGMVFPVYHFFKETLSERNFKIRDCISTDPLKFDALMLSNDDKWKLLLVSFAPDSLNIKIKSFPGAVTRTFCIDSTNVLDSMTNPETFKSTACKIEYGTGYVTIDLSPFSFLVIEGVFSE